MDYWTVNRRKRSEFLRGQVSVRKLFGALVSPDQFRHFTSKINFKTQQLHQFLSEFSQIENLD